MLTITPPTPANYCKLMYTYLIVLALLSKFKAIVQTCSTLFTYDGISRLLFSIVHVTVSRIRTTVSTAYSIAPT